MWNKYTSRDVTTTVAKNLKSYVSGTGSSLFSEWIFKYMYYHVLNSACTKSTKENKYSALRNHLSWSLATHWVHREDESDWPDTQADLSLRWAQSHFVGFGMRLNYVSVTILSMNLDLGISRLSQSLPQKTTKLWAPKEVDVIILWCEQCVFIVLLSWCNYLMVWTMCFYHTANLPWGPLYHTAMCPKDAEG